MSETVAEILLKIGSVKFSFKNHFTLTSGHKSPVYVDCRKIISFVNERNFIMDESIKYLKDKKIKFDLLAGGETAGIPYSAILAEKMNKPMIYIRKKSKGFGRNQQIEGEFKNKDTAILIEDLATDGGSKIVFINAMRQGGLRVKDIFVIFFYNIFDFTNSELSKLNVSIHSLCTWQDIIELIEKEKIYSENNINNLKEFLSNPNDWRKKYV